MAKAKGTNNSPDDLFQLIKSLTQNEKRYVKMYSAHGTGTKNYLLLFDAMEAETHYEEEAFRSQHESAPFNTYFAQNKASLKSNILRAMRAFHEKETASDEVLVHLKDYRFLREKGLYKQAKATLKKARKIADDNQLDLLLLHINEIESRSVLKHQGNKKKLEATVSMLQKEQIAIRDRLRVEHSFVNFYRLAQVNFFLGNRDLVRNQLNDFIAIADPNYVLQNPEKYSFETRLSYLMTEALHAEANGNSADFYQTYRRILEIFEQNQQEAALDPLRYVKLTSNYLTACHSLSLYHEFSPIIEKQKKMARGKISHHLQGEILQSLYLNEALLYMNTNNWEMAATIPAKVEQLFLNFPDSVNESRKMVLAYNSMIIFFYLEQWDGVRQWCNWLLDEQSKGIREDITRVAMIMDVIYWVEKDEFSLVEYARRRASRKLPKGPSTKLLNRLQKIVNSPLLERSQGFASLAEFLKKSLREKKKGEKLNGFREMHRWAWCRSQGVSILDGDNSELDNLPV